MAIFEKTIRNQNFDTLLRKLEHAIPDSSWSAELEAGSDFKEGSARCSVRVFERYSMVGGNRLSLTLTLFQNGDEPIRLSAIAAGGSQAVFFKMNTLGEDAFLEDVRAKGTYLRNQIEALDLPCFGATRGMGLMIGIQVKDGWTNKEIASKLIENGLLVLTAGPKTIRLLPPLVISQEEMDTGLAALKDVLVP